jgi:hypothetical protein
MHALVVEGVEGLAEKLLVGGAAVQRGVVFAGHESDRLDLEVGHDGLELRQAAAAFGGVVGGVRQVAGEDDELGRRAQRVHRRHGLAQRDGGVRVGRALVAPVGVGELHEVEVAGVAAGGGHAAGTGGAAGQAGGEDGTAAERGEGEEVTTLHGGFRKG